MESVFSDTGIEHIKAPYYFNIYVGIIYFLKTFKNVCISNIENIIWINNTIHIPPDFYERIQICQDNKEIRFIFGFLILVDGGLSHQNVFIIDIKENSVEVFEPHGSTNMYNNDLYIKSLKELFLEKVGIKLFYQSTDFCPKVSFQILQAHEKQTLPNDPPGFCQTWSIWWVYYRIKNSNKNISRDQLVKEAIQNMQGNMTIFIRKYAAFIAKTRTKLLKQIDPKLLENINNNPELVSYSEEGMIGELLEKEIEKITPKYKSAERDHFVNLRGKCVKEGCPDDLMCRLATGKCVKNKYKLETLYVENGQKYLRHAYDMVVKPTIIPTLENFSEIYVREYIYNICGDNLTKDELYLVLFYNKPINSAEKIWKNL